MLFVPLFTPLPLSQVKRVFASLANGTLCVFARKSIQLQQDSIGDAKFIPEACTISCDEDQFRKEAEDWADPLILLLGMNQKAAKCMVFVGQSHLWCGCGNTITVVDIVQMKVVKSIPVFVKRMALVNELVSNDDKVWGVGRQLSCVMEWDAKNFNILHVFNCNVIDPTSDIIKSDPKGIDDLHDGESRPTAASISDPRGEDVRSQLSGFTVENDPKRAAPFSQSSTRRTLRGCNPRKRLANMKDDVGRAMVTSTRDLVRHRQKGSTRTTSLLIMGKTLWVARGMGDILVIDIGGSSESHGRVLTRLATEGCEKFGNKSYHKLVCVAGEYVVSSQWLEPVDIRSRATTMSGGTPSTPDMPRAAVSRQREDTEAMAHQAITIWNAWNHDSIGQFMSRRSAQLMQELDDVV